MAYDFPASPTIGQIYQGYTWDGEKWVGTTAGPASALPLMNGVATVGTSVKYTREDHVHPVDTSRAPAGSYLPLSGGVMTGKLTSAGSSGSLSGTLSNALEVDSTVGSDAFMSFLRAGSFGVNFGLGSDNNLYYGGYSFGTANYRIWTTRDFAALPNVTPYVSNARMVVVGNYLFTAGASIVEPYNGGICTAIYYSGTPVSQIGGAFRYLQLLTAAAGWWTVAYA